MGRGGGGDDDSMESNRAVRRNNYNYPPYRSRFGEALKFF